MPVPDVFGWMNKAYDAFARLKAIEDKIANAELRNANGDLKIALANIKDDVARLTEENAALRAELGQERERKQESEKLVAKDGALFFEEPPVGVLAGPYCPNCKRNSNRLELMQDNRGSQWEELFRFHCHACGTKLR